MTTTPQLDIGRLIDQARATFHAAADSPDRGAPIAAHDARHAYEAAEGARQAERSGDTRRALRLARDAEERLARVPLVGSTEGC